MKSHRYPYPREKYCAAVEALIGLGSIKKRVRGAYGSFHPLASSHFGDKKLFSKHEAIIKALTEHKTPDVYIGRVDYTLSQITDEEAVEISNSILDLHYDLLKSE